MNEVRIAHVRYLNTVPLIEGLAKTRSLRLVAAVPSKLAGMLAGGEADIALASLIDAARSPVPFTILPAGMIGCDGPTLTVRVFSKVPLANIATLHADTDSHTSVALCRVVLKKLYGVNAEVIDFDARERIAVGGSGPGEEWPEAVLLIGDKVVADSPPAVRYPYQLDLGEAWKQLTGLPFVYAAWMCRTADVDRPEIRAAAALLDRTRRHNRARLDWVVEHHAAEHRWPTDLARRYLGELLRYQVGPRERESMQRFLDECAGLGLCATTTLTFGSLAHAALAGA